VDEGRKKQNKRLGQIEKWKIEDQLKPDRHTHVNSAVEREHARDCRYSFPSSASYFAVSQMKEWRREDGYTQWRVHTVN